MTQSPAMMLWTDSYLGDTSHLTTTEHGAYLLILMAMWRAGGALPNDESRLARTARLSLDKWRKIASTIMEFMTVTENSVTQKRLKLEFEIASGRREKLERAGRAGGRAKALKNLNLAPSDATPLPVAEVRQSPSLPITSNQLPEKKERNLKVSCPKQVRTRLAYPEDFERFWAAYPTDANMSKKEALREWQRLPPEDREMATASIAAFKVWAAMQRDYRTVHAVRYLSQRRFEGHAETALKTSSQVFVRVGGEQWRAWERWYATEHRGKKPPINKEGTGWWFRAEWPPATQLEGAA